MKPKFFMAVMVAASLVALFFPRLVRRRDGRTAALTAEEIARRDAALTAVADTLCAELRDYDLCGRFGGDEFVVVLPETALDEATEVAKRIDTAVSARDVTSGRTTFSVTLSTGVAMLTPAHGFSLKALLADADATMYKAKATRATVLA